MSTKATSSKKESLKLSEPETILTRHKSAQLKRQLRNKEQSIKKISQMTQLLRSPTSNKSKKSPESIKKGPKTKTQSPKKSKLPKTPERHIKRLRKLVKNEEYYPNKLKRKVDAKKVLLKPKHELKRIGSKRKLAVPHKGIKSPPLSKLLRISPSPDESQPSPKPPDLTMEDIVKLTEESDLNDEDLLEILTCPSPVWWEDPPDPWHIEGSIFTLKSSSEALRQRLISPADNKIDPASSHVKSNESSDELEHIMRETNAKTLVTKQTDDKFMKKRTKLESLLGNIKNKLNTNIPQTHNAEDFSKTSKDNTNPMDRNLDSEKAIGTVDETGNSVTKYSKIEKYYKNIDTGNDRRKDKASSESTESDDPFAALRDDDLLNDLENMDIPIEPEVSISSDDSIVVDNLDPCSSKSSFLGSGKDLHELDPEIVDRTKVNNSLSDRGNVNDSKRDQSNNVENILEPKEAKTNKIELNSVSQIKKDDTLSNIPVFHKLTLTSIQKDTDSSPTSLRSTVSEDTSSSQDNLDTISDTNIQFIDDDCDTYINKDCYVTKDIEIDEMSAPKTVINNTIHNSQPSETNKQFTEKNHDTSNSENEVRKICNATSKDVIVNYRNCDKFKKLSKITVHKLTPISSDALQSKISITKVELSNMITLKTQSGLVTVEKPKVDPRTSKTSPNMVISKSKPNGITIQKAEILPSKLHKSNMTIVQRNMMPNIIKPVIRESNPNAETDKRSKPSNDVSDSHQNLKPNGVKIQRDKTDVMRVYKIICKDKFPLHNTPPSNDTFNPMKSSESVAGTDKINSVDNEQNNHDANIKSKMFLKKYKNTSQKISKNPSEIKSLNLVLNTDDQNDIKTNDIDKLDLKTIENRANEPDDNNEETGSKLCKSKSIVVPNSDKVKYCLKCSCIFETDDCDYCLKHNKNDQTEAFVQDVCHSCKIPSFHEQSRDVSIVL